MGSSFEVYEVTANNDLELEVKYVSLVEKALYDHGHSGYSGTIAESPGLTVVTEYSGDSVSSEEYIMENAKKWENSLAIQIKGSNRWLIGGWYSS